MRIISTLPTIIDFSRCIIRPLVIVNTPLSEAKELCETDVFKWEINEDIMSVGNGGVVYVSVERKPFIYFDTKINEEARVYIFKDIFEFSKFMLHHFGTLAATVNYMETMHSSNEETIDYLDNYHPKIKLEYTTHSIKFDEIERDMASHSRNENINYDSDVE